MRWPLHPETSQLSPKRGKADATAAVPAGAAASASAPSASAAAAAASVASSSAAFQPAALCSSILVVGGTGSG